MSYVKSRLQPNNRILFGKQLNLISEINLFVDKTFTVRILEHILHVGYDWSLGSYLPIRSEVND